MENIILELIGKQVVPSQAYPAGPNSYTTAHIYANAVNTYNSYLETDVKADVDNEACFHCPLDGDIRITPLGDDFNGDLIITVDSDIVFTAVWNEGLLQILTYHSGGCEPILNEYSDSYPKQYWMLGIGRLEA